MLSVDAQNCWQRSLTQCWNDVIPNIQYTEAVDAAEFQRIVESFELADRCEAMTPYFPFVHAGIFFDTPKEWESHVMSEAHLCSCATQPLFHHKTMHSQEARACIASRNAPPLSESCIAWSIGRRSRSLLFQL